MKKSTDNTFDKQFFCDVINETTENRAEGSLKIETDHINEKTKTNDFGIDDQDIDNIRLAFESKLGIILDGSCLEGESILDTKMDYSVLEIFNAVKAAVETQTKIA